VNSAMFTMAAIMPSPTAVARTGEWRMLCASAAEFTHRTLDAVRGV